MSAGSRICFKYSRCRASLLLEPTTLRVERADREARMQLPSENLLRFASFPKGPTSWRLDWFGDVAFPDAAQRRRQPSIFVYLSPVDEKAINEVASLLSPEVTQSGWAQRGCWISVGALPLLRIGDIWRDGQLHLRPDYQLETFVDLQIDGDTTTLVKAGLNKDEQGFLLPLAEHPWHRKCTHSYCLEVALGGNRRMLIPCMEMIRFYFGSSSKLINRLFTPPLAAEALYTKAEFDHSKGRLILDLAEGMSGASAADIGRIHRDPLAWRAAKLMGASLLKMTPGAEATFPQAVFPFEGKTTLVAAGKWLSYAGVENATFIVFNLRSCSYPFPFRSLRYEVRQPIAQSSANVGWSEQLTSVRKSSRRRTATGSQDLDLVERDPSKSLATRILPMRDAPRFRDLLHKPVWKQALLPNPLGSESGPPTPDISQLSTGKPDREHRIRSVDLTIAVASPQPPPDFLQTTIKRLKRLRRLDMTLLTASEHDGWTVPITMLCDVNGEIDPHLFIVEPHGKSRLRRVCAFGLRAKHRRYCLLLIEASPVYRQRSAVGAEEVWEIIDRVASDFLSRGADQYSQSSLRESVALE